MSKEHSEYQAKETLRQTWHEGVSARIAIINICNNDGPAEEIEQEIINYLTDRLTDPELMLYKFHNEDLLIQSRYLCHIVVDELVQHLSRKFPRTEWAKRVSIYDVNKHWPNISQYMDMTIKALERKLKEVEEQKVLFSKKQCEKRKRRKFLNIHVSNDIHGIMLKKKRERKNLEIMVIDDDRFSKELLECTLGETYTLKQSSSAIGGFKDYLAIAPDILFLDIDMPNINGHDFLLKIFDLDPTAFVVMLSGNGDPSNIQKSIDLGAKGFVSKPFTRSKLIDYIDKARLMKARSKE